MSEKQSLVAGIDSSTQSVKVVVRDAYTGALVREARAPHPEGTEVDSRAWWSALESILPQALDGVSVEVAAPTDPSAKVAYLAELENVEVARAAPAAKVIINSRSGTIVFGSQVTVGPAAVAHGNLTVTVDESLLVSQPGPFARGGQTAVVPDTDITIEEEEVRMFAFEGGVDLSEIVTAVNRVGAAPGDLVAILEALQKAGAISAQLIVI